MAYVYCHFKLSSPHKIFYIGVGGLNKFDNYKRAKDKRKRSNLWKHFASKVNWDWDILEDNLDKKTALEREIWWINARGRYNLGKGMIANLTDGGEGGSGHVISEETKEYLRNKYKGKPRPEHVRKAMNRLGWNHNKKSKEKISNSLKGENNPFYGKKQPKWVKDKSSKPVINIENGIFYDSVKEASLTTHHTYDHFKGMLNGRIKNITSFKYC